jgi:hypothetical protein
MSHFGTLHPVFCAAQASTRAAAIAAGLSTRKKQELLQVKTDLPVRFRCISRADCGLQPCELLANGLKVRHEGAAGSRWAGRHGIVLDVLSVRESRR